MQQILEEVLRLQPQWVSRHTPPMRRRGVLIGKEAPEWLRRHLPDLQARMPTVDDLAVEGRDNTGRKSRVPWVRVYSASRSRRARFGFYVVYLFDQPGDAVYLSLNQGTTIYDGKEMRGIPPALIEERRQWARSCLGEFPLAGVDLRSTSDLASGYQLGDVASLRYTRGNVPDDDVLLADLHVMAQMLGQVHAAADLDAPPGEGSADVVQVEELLSAFTGRRPGASSSGFRANAAQRKVIEDRAVAVATDHLRGSGWSVKNVGQSRPYDLHATKDGLELHVEVKGTVTTGGQVILTRGEVLHHAHAPASALCIVSGIELSGTSTRPRAHGGVLRSIDPWSIDEDALTPIAFRYVVPEG